MPQKAICLDTLGQLDQGAAALVIDAAIREAIKDLDDRGEDGKPRQVNIVLNLQRLDGGQVMAHVEASPKLPRRRTGGTVGKITCKGGESNVLFEPHSPDNPDQKTIHDFIQDEE